MSKIELPTITSGYNLSTINNNFQKIEDTLNKEVLYRKGYLGEPNEMQTNLDMNGKQILNVTTGTSDGSLVTKWYVDQGMALKFDKSGGPLSGSVDMSSNEITNVSRLSTNTLDVGGVPVVPTDLVIYYRDETREALRRSYAEAGYNLVGGSFETGGTVTTAADVLLFEADGEAYSWGGSLPKVIPAASTPASTGGVADGAWVPVSDITLREGLASAGGVRNVSGAEFKVAGISGLLSATWLVVGDVVSTGASKFKKTASGSTLAAYTPLGTVYGRDFDSPVPLSTVLSTGATEFDFSGVTAITDLSVSNKTNARISNLSVALSSTNNISLTNCKNITFDKCDLFLSDPDVLANQYGKYYDASKNVSESLWNFIRAVGCSDLSFESCSFVKYGDVSLFIENSSAITIRDCYFGGGGVEIGAYNYSLHPNTPALISNNVFNFITDRDALKLYGYTDTVNIKDNLFFEYGVRTSKSGVIYHDGIDTYRRGQDIVITGNTFKTNQLAWAGVQCKNVYRDSGENSNVDENNKYINISDNWFSGGQYNIVIKKFDERSSPVYHEFNEYVKFNIIHGNTFRLASVYSIWCDGLAYSSISSNVFLDAQEHIRLRFEAESVSISDNKFYGHTSVGVTIGCVSAARRISVSDNIFKAAAGAQNILLYETLTGADISRNVFNGGVNAFKTDPFCNMTAVRINGNIITNMTNRPWALSGSDSYNTFELSQNIINSCALDAAGVTKTASSPIGYETNISDFTNSVLKRNGTGDSRFNNTTGKPNWWNGTAWVNADGTPA